MTAHPLNLAVITTDVVALLLLLMAAFSCARIVSGWQPGQPTRAQLRLERSAEVASLQGRFAAAAFILGSVVFIVTIAAVLPAVVPGSMCGTGVVQATGGLAVRALVLRLVALLLITSWQVHDGLDRSAPLAPLGTTPAKLLLLATPVMVVAALDTASSLKSLDLHTPVDCCAAVYDQVAPRFGNAVTTGIPDALLTWSTLGLGVLLVVAATWVWRGAQGLGGRWPGLLLAGVALVWVPIATVALVRVFSAYHYGVLHHHCPWCLFLGRHRLVGFPLFTALGIVLFEGTGTAMAALVGMTRPEVQSQARARVQKGALRMLVALLIYALLAGLPALLWRWSRGVWITG